MSQLAILLPSGHMRTVPLEGDRLTLGRANNNDLPFPEDAGLSRSHLIFERRGDQWIISDPGSKNGTYINGNRLTSSQTLNKGDRIAAGHLVLVYDTSARSFQHTVVFVEANRATAPSVGVVATNLNRALPVEKPQEPQAPVRADRVAALIRAGRELATHRPLSELFPLILDLAVEAVNAERGVLLIIEDGALVPQASTTTEAFRISSGVRDRVLQEKTSILVNDVLSDEAFRGMQSLVSQQVQMLMAVPLQTGDHVLGLIYVDSPSLTRHFTVDDLNLLTVMANVAAVRIEHARLAEVEHAERIMAKDLEQAAAIQQGLLPAHAPQLPGVDLAGYNAACRSVGGDYYDFIPYPDGRVAIALGDVSGKAMPAALLMTSLQARVQVLAEEPPDLSAMMRRLNRITAATCPEGRFISFFFSVLDPRTGDLAYSNAGHNPPLVMHRDGSVEWLTCGGLLLGIFPDVDYEAGKTNMAPGDVLVIFSDGVTEAMNGAGEEFGEHRLAALLKPVLDQTAREIATYIREAVDEFVAGAAAADDFTIVVAKHVGLPTLEVAAKSR